MHTYILGILNMPGFFKLVSDKVVTLILFTFKLFPTLGQYLSHLIVAAAKSDTRELVTCASNY
jgi:hypothetical protein